MKAMKILSVLAVSMAVACGGSSTPKQSFPKPAGTVAVNFKVDDRANALFLDKEMQWKGGMLVDPSTRVATADSTWGGKLPDGSAGWASLYDDGPWDTCTGTGTTLSCGHEPLGSVPGDHIFGATIFVKPPATGADAYGYGLIDHKYGDGWLWTGHTADGKFSVAAGATADIDVEGHTFPKFGTTDVQVTLDKNLMDKSTTWDTSKVTIKGSGWSWNEVPLKDDGSGKFIFTISSVAGAPGKQFSHSGLATSGDKSEFIFVLGGTAAKSGLEYKGTDTKALTTGVSGGTKAAGATAFTPATVQIKSAPGDLSNGNTYILVP